MANAAAELWAVARIPEVWGTLGWADIKLRYRRTMIGPFWLTLSLGVMILGIGFLYAGLFQSETSVYIPYLATGLVVWMFISTTVTEGCTIFIVSAPLIKATTMPMPNYVFRLVWKNLIIFAHNMLIVVFLWLFFPLPGVAALPWFVLGLLLNVVMLFGLVLTLSVICTRFRDVPQIVIAAMQLIFFITPIIWIAENLRVRRDVVDFNPLYHFIEVIRQPLLGNVPQPTVWLITAVLAAISLVVGIASYAASRRKLAYWL
ncbi:MAG TPA: ABC transporter permease [Xanthobacteraceae bacterium]